MSDDRASWAAVAKKRDHPTPERRMEVKAYRPDRWVTLRARTSEYYGEGFDLRIEERPKSEGYWLTVEDMATNDSTETNHPTLEAAKRHAVDFTRVREISWRKR